MNHSVRYLGSTMNESLSTISWLQNEWMSDILGPHWMNHSARYIGFTWKNQSDFLAPQRINQSDIVAPQRINHSVRYRSSMTLSVCSHILSNETTRRQNNSFSHLGFTWNGG